MKNIAIVIPFIRRGGGAEKIATWLSDILSKHGYNVLVITFANRENEYSLNCDRLNIDSNSNIRLINYFKRSLLLSKLVKTRQIECIISFTEEASAVCVLSKIFGQKAKVVLAVRNNPLSRSFFSKLFIKNFYVFADRVIANSLDMFDILVTKIGLKKVSLINNPCDIDLNRMKSSDELEKSFLNKIEGKKVFINMGRLIPQKGQINLIRSFKKVVDKYKDAVLVIMGGGMMESELKKFTENLNIQNSILFTGVVQNVYPYLKRSDCFVMSSFWEGFPNAIIDALSLDKTVISTDCKTGPRELLCNCEPGTIDYPHFCKYGILINTLNSTNDEDNLSNLMINSVDNNSWRDKYSCCSDRVEILRPEIIAEKWIEILN